MGDDRAATVLVLGGHGFVGAAVLSELERRPSTHVTAPRSTELDLRRPEAVADAVHGLRPRAVLNLAAVNPGQGRDDALAAVNHHAAAAVAAACRDVGARLVHVSTDVVLDGDHAPYDDDAPAAPLFPYGVTKALGETAVIASGADAVAVRTSLVFDAERLDRSTREFAARLAAGEPVVLFTDELRMPIARTTLARALVELIDTPYRGRLNVAGAQPLSRFEFGARLLEWFDVPGREHVRGAASAPLGLRRPRDLTLELARARSLLRTPLLSVDHELAAARRKDLPR